MTRSLFVIENGRGEFWMPRRERDAEMEHYGANSHRSDPTAGIVEYVPRQRWIPVGERLPEHERDVLIAYNLAQDVGRCELTANGVREWRISHSKALPDSEVTHWMTLPEGPEE